MTSQHSSSRTSLPSLGSSTVCTSFIRSHQEKCCLAGLDLVSRLSVRHRPCKCWDLPRSWAALMHLCPALRPRMDSLARPMRRASTVPADTTTRTPIDNKLSGLYHTASVLTAGTVRSMVGFAGWVTPPPRKTRFRLLASSAGWDWLPTGLLRKVSDTGIRYMIILLSQATWRNVSFVSPPGF